MRIADRNDPLAERFRWRDRQLGSRLAGPEAPLGLFAAEGDLVVERGLDAGYELDSVLVDAQRVPSVLARVPPGVPVFFGDAPVRRELTGLGVVLDIVALFHRRAVPSVSTVIAPARRVLAVEQVDNPTNLGGIVRSAAALGIDALVLDETSADPLGRRAVRTSMGTTFSLPYARSERFPDDLDSLRQLGFRLLALTPSPDSTPLDRVELRPEERAVLLFGSERNGLSPGVLALAEPVGIPMRRGINSLNVAAAAAIACYEFGR